MGLLKPTPHRLAGMVALAVPTAMWSLFLVVGLTRPGYNMLTRAASDLAIPGTGDATLFAIGFFILPGFLTALVCAALMRLGPANALWRAGALAMGLAGALLLLGGLFPTAGVSAFDTSIHQDATQACFAIAAACPLILLAGSRGTGLPAWVGRLWLLSGVGSLAIEAGALVLRTQTTFPQGFFQRPFLATLTVWFCATGIWLLQQRKPTVTA